MGFNEIGLTASAVGLVPNGASAQDSVNPLELVASSLHVKLAALRRDEPTPARYLREAALLFYLARSQTKASKQSRRESYEQGWRLALQAADREPGNPAAIFWAAANEAGIAEIDKNIAALATLARLEGILLELKKDHPDYGYGAADRLLGALYAAAPAFISIGSKRKAEACLQEALRCFPNFPGNQIAWAKFLSGRGQDRDAAQIATQLAKHRENPPEYWHGPFGDFDLERPFWEADLAAILPTGQAKP